MTSTLASTTSTVTRGLTTPFTTPNTGPSSFADPSRVNRGLCTLSFRGRNFTFRTNPNDIWWDYELVTNIDQTYGGRVIQLLAVRLGDLRITVECGKGGWEYLKSMVYWLRDLISDQRGGDTAEFEYTTRNWHLKVYGMSIPFQDQVDATVREVALNFKIQEDVSGVLSQVTLSTELAKLQAGVYGPGAQPHNRFNDPDFSAEEMSASMNASGPAYRGSGIVNSVDYNPTGEWSTGGILSGTGLLNSIPGLGSIAGLGDLNLGSIPGLSYMPGLSSIPGL